MPQSRPSPLPEGFQLRGSPTASGATSLSSCAQICGWLRTSGAATLLGGHPRAPVPVPAPDAPDQARRREEALLRLMPLLTATPVWTLWDTESIAMMSWHPVSVSQALSQGVTGMGSWRQPSELCKVGAAPVRHRHRSDGGSGSRGRRANSAAGRRGSRSGQEGRSRGGPGGLVRHGGFVPRSMRRPTPANLPRSSRSSCQADCSSKSSAPESTTTARGSSAKKLSDCAALMHSARIRPLHQPGSRPAGWPASRLARQAGS